MSDQWAIRSRRVVTPEGVRDAAVVVQDERIAAVVSADETATGIDIEDLGDLVISPSVVDAHVHVNEPGRTDWEGFESATRSAAAGGVTTIVDMPLNSSPVTTSVEALELKRQAAAEKCWVDVAFYGGLVPGSAGNIASLLDSGVRGIKAFLCDSGLDEFPAASPTDLNAAMPAIAATGSVLLVHCELPIAAPTPGDPRSYEQYLASRPDRWELDAISKLIDLCRTHQCRVHVVHLSSAEALEMIDAARREGLPLSVETCPHYLFFSADEIPDGDTRFKCAPPIRSSDNQSRLWAALESGLIDTIGSDHSPCPAPLKHFDSGDFLSAWGGISSLQMTLPIVWTGASRRGVSLTQMARWLSQSPARLIGMKDHKGRIAPGVDADIVVWDSEAEWVVDADMLHHRHKLTPYAGRRLRGKVVRTYVRGQAVFQDGAVADEPIGHLN